MKYLLEDNGHLIFVKKVHKYLLNDGDTFMLLHFFIYTLAQDILELDFRDLSQIYERNSDFTPVKRRLQNGTHALLIKGLIENVCSGGFDDKENFRLTDIAKEEFLVELEETLSAMPVK